MVDVTQTMACIQCGACVSDCLSMEVDPGFIGPAALSKAYRFVGDPRDDQHEERLWDLSKDPHGIYDCTHCFNCVQACPKGVAPMDQIMRLRRRAGSDFDLEDPNNGYRHEHAFVNNIKRNGILHEPDLLADSYGGKFHPRAVPELLSGLPAAAIGLARGKMTPSKLLLHSHKAPKDVKRIFEKVEGREDRVELNLYIVGYDEVEEKAAAEDGTAPGSGASSDTKPEADADTTAAIDRTPPQEQSAPSTAQEEAPSNEGDEDAQEDPADQAGPGESDDSATESESSP
jgi:succinate dehydrogenase / fumarate reductase iron-sulfur subunit